MSEQTQSSFFKDLKRTIHESWKEVSPILLSHHPNCVHFKHHTLNIGKIRLCIGCFIGYPTAILSFVGFTLFFFKSHPVQLWLLLLGIMAFLPIFLSFTEWTEIKLIKIGQKFLVGFGSGLILAYFFSLLSPTQFWQKIALFYGISLVLMIPIGLLHYRTMTNACANCVDKWDPDLCDLNFCMAASPYDAPTQPESPIASNNTLK